MFFSGRTVSLERSVVMALIRDKRKLGLRVLGMDQECRASIDVGAQQAQAFVGGVPRLDDDVVQFVAQEVFDHALVARLDFEKIGEHSGGSVPPCIAPDWNRRRTDSVE